MEESFQSSKYVDFRNRSSVGIGSKKEEKLICVLSSKNPNCQKNVWRSRTKMFVNICLRIAGNRRYLVYYTEDYHHIEMENDFEFPGSVTGIPLLKSLQTFSLLFKRLLYLHSYTRWTSGDLWIWISPTFWDYYYFNIII